MTLSNNANKIRLLVIRQLEMLRDGVDGNEAERDWDSGIADLNLSRSEEDTAEQEFAAWAITKLST